MSVAAHTPVQCGIVPPQLLVRVARQGDPRFAGAAAAARDSLLCDEAFRDTRRAAPVQHLDQGLHRPGAAPRSVWNARGSELLPGIQARTEGTPPTPDAAVNEVYDGLGSARVLLWNAFHRDSLDDHGMPLRATVHFASHYDNAVWDGSRFVFGDGDGQVFARFTRSLSALGHEFGHALVQQTADLDYLGQSGALHESLADVFGSLVDQYAHGHSAAQATWLIGEGLFIDELDAHAIRSLKAPGTAYNDDVLGKDPQPSSMADYVETDDDNGGVHLNSGIPNRAFFLVATWLGGNAWEAPGQIWYNTLTAGTLAPCVDFTGFARATTRTASSMFGEGSTEHTAVAAAWREVGVVA